jgi:hypothetical protein
LAARRVVVALRAGDFLAVVRAVAVFLAGALDAALVAVVLRAGLFFAVVFLAPVVRLAAVFLVGLFFAVVFLAGDFFAVFLAVLLVARLVGDAFLVADFLAAVAFVVVLRAGDFFAVVFLAGDFLAAVALVVVLRAGDFFAVVFLAGDFFVARVPLGAFFVVFFAAVLAAPTGLVTAFLAPDPAVFADLFAVVVAGTFSSLMGCHPAHAGVVLVVRMTLFDVLICDLSNFGASRKPFMRFVFVLRADRVTRSSGRPRSRRCAVFPCV